MIQELLQNKTKTLWRASSQSVNNILTYSMAIVSDKDKLDEVKKNYSAKDSVLLNEFVNSFNFSTLGKIDIILIPSSGSILLKSFGSIIAKRLGCQLIQDAFIKTLPSEVYIEISPSINCKPKTIIELGKILDKAMVSGFQMKKVPAIFRKFFRGFIKHEIDMKTLNGRRILIIDDVLTSGATFSEIYRQLSIVPYESINGLTLFKMK